MNLFSTDEHEQNEGHPRCPACRSDRITHYRHPQTNERVSADGLHLAICMKCEHVFGISETQERYMPVEDEIGERIDEELQCPTCNYNLKSLQFGAICPGCSTRIPPSKIAIDDIKHGPDRDIPTWLAVGLWMIAIGGVMASRATESPYGLILAIMLGGWYDIRMGRRGLRQRRVFAPSFYFVREVRGGFAVFWSYFHLGTGSLLLAAGVVWLAIIVLQRLGIL